VIAVNKYDEREGKKILPDIACISSKIKKGEKNTGREGMIFSG